MKILLTGACGQLGTELRQVLPALGTLTSADIALPAGECADFRRLDFCDSEDLMSLLDDIRPDTIVNAAAYTQVDQSTLR